MPHYHDYGVTFEDVAHAPRQAYESIKLFDSPGPCILLTIVQLSSTPIACHYTSFAS